MSPDVITALTRGQQKIISEYKSQGKKSTATKPYKLEAFGQAAQPLKNSVITESLIDDVEGMRKRMFGQGAGEKGREVGLGGNDEYGWFGDSFGAGKDMKVGDGLVSKSVSLIGKE